MMKKMITEAAPPPPPPPPPTPAPTATAPAAAGGKTKKFIIVGLLIAIVVVSAVVIVLLATGGSKPSPGTGTNTNTGTAGPSGTSGSSMVGTAQSLQFSVTYTSSEGASSSWGYTFYAKNIGTSNMMMRVDGNYGGQNSIYIVNGAQRKAWMSVGGQWMDLSNQFADEWNTWDQTFQGYRENLLDWVGTGDITYSDPGGGTVRVYDIHINPSLPDSLFQG
ncbi:MAG: hypothetical protein ACE14S_07370 [Candidatus Bathyarchaeia archaeon]